MPALLCLCYTVPCHRDTIPELPPRYVEFSLVAYAGDTSTILRLFFALFLLHFGYLNLLLLLVDG
jgi:hypothetical protein